MPASQAEIYCCFINYMSLGDTKLHMRTRSRQKAVAWRDKNSYFSKMLLTKAEYLERMKAPQHNDADPY